MRILVVDDEKIIADTLTIILRRNSYECRTAYDGEEAFLITGEFAPHLIISDVIMPKVNGIELFHRVRKLSNPPAILLISGNAATYGMIEDDKLLQCLLPVLEKPISPPRLLAIVAAMAKDIERQASEKA